MADAKPGPQNKRILVVDDEKDIVQAYIDFLAPAVATAKKSSRSSATESTVANEYEILQANSGEQALEIVKKCLAENKHVAGGFFDVKMDGGMDGIQTIQEIWKLDPEMHCTIVTAYQDRTVQDIDLLFGPNHKDQWDYLTKPFMGGEIIQKARQMVAAWEKTRGLEDTLEQLKATQAQLVYSERMAAIGQVARGVGHEFGNILQRIVGKADLLLNCTDLPKIHTDVGTIITAAERAAVIVRNLQSFSKTSSAKADVNLMNVIADSLALIEHELKKYTVELVDKRQAVPVIKANNVELQQVLMNLMINAIHAMPQGGKLEVGCGESNGSVLFWIKDTGVGIPPEIMPRIFEYAFTTKGDRGSGLGLSISKQIVEAHGGSILVKSEPGKGSIFTIKLPSAGASK